MANERQVASQCLWGYGTPNQCTRKSYEPFCWQHKDAFSKQSASPTPFQNPSVVPSSALSISDPNEVWSFMDTVSNGTPGIQYSDRALLDLSSGFTDFATLRLIEREFPGLDTRAYIEHRNPSDYIVSLESSVTNALRIRPVYMTPSDIEEIVRSEGFHPNGGLNSYEANMAVSAYSLRLLWEKAQLEGTANQQSELGFPYGDNYERFVALLSDSYDARVEQAFNLAFENWDSTIRRATGNPPKTVASLSARQKRAQGRSGPRNTSGPRPVPNASSIPYTGAPSRRFDAPQHTPNNESPRPQKANDSQGSRIPNTGDSYELPSMMNSVADSIGGIFNELKENRAKAKAERLEEERIANAKAAEERAAIEKIALSKGYTYEQWEEKKAREHNHQSALTAERQQRAKKNSGGFFGRLGF